MALKKPLPYSELPYGETFVGETKAMLQQTPSKGQALTSIVETRILDARLLGFHMSGLIACPYVPNKELW
jgi:hypothetical protein